MPRSTVVGLVKAKFSEPQFTPYAIAIGQATLAWNDLHEHLGRVFGLLSERQDWLKSLDRWQACRVDTNKRRMLLGVLNQLPADLASANPDLVPALFWVLAEIDRLQERRNDISHVPLHLVTPAPDPFELIDERELLESAEVQPLYWANNRRATNTASMDVLMEYQRCHETAVALRDFVVDVGKHAEAWVRNKPRGPFPCAPTLPTAYLHQSEGAQVDVTLSLAPSALAPYSSVPD